jgi:hypothetical protein
VTRDDLKDGCVHGIAEQGIADRVKTIAWTAAKESSAPAPNRGHGQACSPARRFRHTRPVKNGTAFSTIVDNNGSGYDTVKGESENKHGRLIMQQKGPNDWQKMWGQDDRKASASSHQNTGNYPVRHARTLRDARLNHTAHMSCPT